MIQAMSYELQEPCSNLFPSCVQLIWDGGLDHGRHRAPHPAKKQWQRLISMTANRSRSRPRDSSPGARLLVSLTCALICPLSWGWVAWRRLGWSPARPSYPQPNDDRAQSLQPRKTGFKEAVNVRVRPKDNRENDLMLRLEGLCSKPSQIGLTSR